MNILNVITNNNLTDIFLVSTSLLVVVLTVLQIIFCKKVPFISLLAVILLVVLSVLFDNLVVYIILDILFVITLGFSIYEYINNYNETNKRNKQANNFLSNVCYDYYFSTNKSDYIVDASESYLDLLGLDFKDLVKAKGLPTMLSELKIKMINGEVKEQTKELMFLSNYNKVCEENQMYQFDLLVEIDGEDVFLKGINQPLYHKGKFIGRNVYLIHDKVATFESLRAQLKRATKEIELTQKQSYALMSLTKNTIMYLDYKTTTYVATEALNTYLGVTQKEFTIDEFYEMIHNEDLNSYKEQGAMINSLMPTRTKLRLYINKKYYEVYDDSIYLNKDSGLVSIISLVSDPEVVSPVKQQEVLDANKWDALEESNPVDIMNELMKNLKKDENNE